MDEDTIYQCGMCGYCLDTCSVYATTYRESMSPRGKLLLVKNFAEGILTDPAAITKRVYTCTLCGNCKDACPSKTDIPSVIKEWRNTHPYQDTVLESCVKSVFEKGNPYNKAQSQREMWYTGDDTDSSTAYFPGCTTSLMQPQIAESFLRIMKNRLSLQIIDDVCCGSILSKTGFEEESKRIIEKNIEYFKEKGIKTLITSCAGCYSFFLEYPFNIKVMHTSQVITEYLDECNPQPIRTTYHDPCHLVRNSITFQPRHILKEISEYTEKEHQMCCGAGGGMLLTSLKLADSICSTMLRDSAPNRTVVTACPFCLYHMKRNSFHEMLSLEEVAALCIL
jgi:Fe-S oxidoreductase